MTTAWDHLPNAGHIDRIIADLTVNPDNWNRTWDAARNRADLAALVAARSAAWDAVRSAARDAAYTAAYTAARNTTRDAAKGAIIALIAWDETGEYLSLPADQVQVLAALGDQRAILILPAVIVFERSKESV